MSDEVEIFTDGACRGNPGPGGWGVVLRAGEQVRPQSTGPDLELPKQLDAHPVRHVMESRDRYLDIHKEAMAQASSETASWLSSRTASRASSR